MAVSGLVVIFDRPVRECGASLAALAAITEIELGEADGHRLGLVVDSPSQERDREIWNLLRELPQVADIAVAMIGFESEDER